MSCEDRTERYLKSLASPFNIFNFSHYSPAYTRLPLCFLPLPVHRVLLIPLNLTSFQLTITQRLRVPLRLALAVIVQVWLLVNVVDTVLADLEGTLKVTMTMKAISKGHNMLYQHPWRFHQLRVSHRSLEVVMIGKGSRRWCIAFCLLLQTSCILRT